MKKDDILDRYKEDKDLANFNIIHIYPKELCNEHGIRNSRFFEVVGFNTVSNKKRNLGKHDDLRKWELAPLNLHGVQVFRDKSTILLGEFKTVFDLSNMTQTLYLR